ncbi:histone-like transcription factor and archaeal histone [Fusarium oxysporum f. sp. phaseoli]
MRKALPADAKLAKDAQECMQQCVSEFVSFIASEGMVDSYIYVHQDLIAAENAQREKRKTVTGDDILVALKQLGFENYGEVLRVYLSKLRDL